MLPPRLQLGATIGVVAPSNYVREDQVALLESFEKRVTELGFRVRRSKHLLDVDKYKVSCASPRQRAEDINVFIKDDDVDAIWCFQGGDTANETLPFIDFEALKKNPKVFIGKSDVDVLLLAIVSRTGLVAFHGCDAKIGQMREFDYDYTQEWFVKRLVEGSREVVPAFEWTCLREGVASGRLLGCNVSSLRKLLGTPWMPDFSGCVLFMESYVTNPRKLLYQLTQLKQAGVLSQARAVVIGHIHSYDDNGSGVSYEQIVLGLTEEYGIPVLKIEEFGHYNPHMFLPIGAQVLVDATMKSIDLVGFE